MRLALASGLCRRRSTLTSIARAWSTPRGKPRDPRIAYYYRFTILLIVFMVFFSNAFSATSQQEAWVDVAGRLYIMARGAWPRNDYLYETRRALTPKWSMVVTTTPDGKRNFSPPTVVVIVQSRCLARDRVLSTSVYKSRISSSYDFSTAVGIIRTIARVYWYIGIICYCFFF